MKEILKEINKNKDNNDLMEKNHIQITRKSDFCDVNIVIGKNGGGKTRFLHYLKDIIDKKDEYNVTFLDCAGYNVNAEEDISGNIIFNEQMSKEVNGNLFIMLRQSLPNVVSQLNMVAMEEIHSLVNTIVDDINGYLEKLLGRGLYLDLEKKTIYFHNCVTGEKLEAMQELPNLSPGEQNALIFALALLCIRLESRPTLLLIDEIETHLHPAMLLALYNMIKEGIAQTETVVFIATHSVHLLSKFEFQEICHCSQGALKDNKGGVYRDILNEVLLGDDTNEDVELFMASVDKWSYAQFMVECLLPPAVVDRVDSKDEQYLKFRNIADKLLKQDEKLQILDYGAGDARIGKCMKLVSDQTGHIPNLTYHIYDKYTILEDFKSGEFVYGNVYKEEEELKKLVGTFDIILLYNVLHEISVEEWCKQLNFMISLLNDNGVLVFGERKTLSVGEKPYGKSGYLVLGEEETKTLFKNYLVEKIGLVENFSAGKREKTLAFAIRAVNQRTSISGDDVIATLEKLEKNTQQIIEDYLLSEESGKIKARDYAFYCQQHMNARMALKLLRDSEEEIKKKTLLFLLHSGFPRDEMLNKIAMRSRYNDEEGKKCKVYLEKELYGRKI